MSRPKRHHILPQNYLEGFCRDGSLWVHDREKGEVREQTPINTLVKGHYYSHQAEDGTKNPVVEEELLQRIDGWFPPLRQELLDGGQLGSNDRYAMAMFIALLLVRTPGFQGQVEDFEKRVFKKVANLAFSDVETTASTLEQMQRETGKQPKTTPEKLHAFHASGEYDIRVSRNESIRLMLETFQAISRHLVEMRWLVLHLSNPRSSFATADNPFVVSGPPGQRVGVATPGAVKLVPLHQSMMLAVLDRCEDPLDSIHIEIKDTAEVRRFNETIVSHSTRFSVARDRALIERLCP